MPHTLLLRLPAAGQEDTEWVSIDETGAPTAAKQRGPLSLAAAVARSAKVVVLAPATQILLAEPELPPGSGVKLARAVPFALEEQLTEDVDQLCFALGRRHAGGRTPVAVVARNVLQSWVSALSGAGIEPYALYADIALVPENPGQTVLWLEGARLAVRRPGMLPFAVELTPVADALAVAGVIPDPLEESSVPKPLESAILYATREDWTRVQDEFGRLADQFSSLKVQLLNEGPLPWLARDLAATDAVNLLQGEFARSTDYGERWRRWRTAALLAVALLVVHVAAAALEIHRANRETAALDTEISQVFSQAMPTEMMHDPRRQMQSRLERIRHSGPGPEYFLRTLDALSSAISVMPNTIIDTLSYREQMLDLKVTAPSLAALSQLSQLVGKRGLTADIESSTPAGAVIEAHLQVRSAAAKAHR
ncbi:MAG TPA: type II secretion system protein GspL [Steroidobacteraceae bacterium]|nr:type II secretion system protein GspL [Steroidobacteraceae bacterium]